MAKVKNTVDRDALQRTIRGETNTIISTIDMKTGSPNTLLTPFADRLEKDISLRSVLNEAIPSGARVVFTRS